MNLQKERLHLSDQDTLDTEVVPVEEAETDEETKQDGEPEEVESPGGSDADDAREQESAPQAKAVAAPTGTGTASANGKAVTWREDPLDFEQSSVEIGITLHPLKNRPGEERAVTICVHNHHGDPVFRSFRVAELTDQMPLDRLQTGIAQVVKAFRGELSARKQAKFEQDQQAAKRKQQQKAHPPTRPASAASFPDKAGAAAPIGVPTTAPLAVAAPAAARKAAPAPALDPLVQQTLF
jgi:hypothetical protein